MQPCWVAIGSVSSNIAPCRHLCVEPILISDVGFYSLFKNDFDGRVVHSIGIDWASLFSPSSRWLALCLRLRTVTGIRIGIRWRNPIWVGPSAT